jgi:hypothetical protein
MHGGNTYVVHPIPEHHALRLRRSTDGRQGMHIVYKRDALVSPKEEFCGIENTITTQDLIEDEAGVHEDPFVSLISKYIRLKGEIESYTLPT